MWFWLAWVVGGLLCGRGERADEGVCQRGVAPAGRARRGPARYARSSRATAASSAAPASARARSSSAKMLMRVLQGAHLVALVRKTEGDDELGVDGVAHTAHRRKAHGLLGADDGDKRPPHVHGVGVGDGDAARERLEAGGIGALALEDGVAPGRGHVAAGLELVGEAGETSSGEVVRHPKKTSSGVMRSRLRGMVVLSGGGLRAAAGWAPNLRILLPRVCEIFIGAAAKWANYQCFHCKRRRLPALGRGACVTRAHPTGVSGADTSPAVLPCVPPAGPVQRARLIRRRMCLARRPALPDLPIGTSPAGAAPRPTSSASPARRPSLLLAPPYRSAELMRSARVTVALVRE